MFFWNGREVKQDSTATYIVQYISSAVVFVGAMLQPMGFIQCLFFSEAFLLVSIAYGVQFSKNPEKVKYFDADSPKARKFALLFLGSAKFSRWMLFLQLLFRNRIPIILSVSLGIIFSVYVAGIFFVSRKFKPYQIVLVNCVAALALASAMLYQHFTRNLVYAHHVNEVRMLYAGLTQIGYVVLVLLAPMYISFWKLESIGLVLWVLFFLCTGHRGFSPG